MGQQGHNDSGRKGRVKVWCILDYKSSVTWGKGRVRRKQKEKLWGNYICSLVEKLLRKQRTKRGHMYAVKQCRIGFMPWVKHFWILSLCPLVTKSSSVSSLAIGTISFFIFKVEIKLVLYFVVSWWLNVNAYKMLDIVSGPYKYSIYVN